MADGDSARKRSRSKSPSLSQQVKKARKQEFLSEYQAKYPFLRRSSIGPNSAHCTWCKSDFSIGHGGADDIRKHVATKKHKQRGDCVQSCGSVASFFRETDEFSTRCIKSEVIQCLWLVENNLPISVSDSTKQLYQAMFPDSQVSSKFSCGRTKTTAILKALAKERQNELSSLLRNNPFSLATDGSNDDFKLYPIVVKVYNFHDSNKITANLLALPNLEGASTGKNIADLIKSELLKRDIPMKNCIGFGTDNAASMVGSKQGCSKFLKESCDLEIIGCPCHLLAIATEKAAKTLPINIEELLIDVYYYLDKSAKRKQTLREFQCLHSGNVHKILKHVSTRWLSLGKCIERLLEQWTALKAYFEKETPTEKRCHPRPTAVQSSGGKGVSVAQKSSSVKGKSSTKASTPGPSSKCSKPKRESTSLSRVERIQKALNSKTYMAYVLFLNYAIPMMDRTNVFLQAEAPLIHLLRRKLQSAYLDILSKFVKPKVVSEADNLLHVDYRLADNQKEAKDILIGVNTRNHIVLKLTDKGITDFYKSVIEFYASLCDYFKKKLPMNSVLLQHAEVLDVSLRQSVGLHSLMYFVDRFPVLCEKEKVNQLQNEFASYQMFKFHESVLQKTNLDEQWSTIKKLTDESGQPMFRLISEVMLGIMVLPHSNVDCERIFSLVTKNLTKFRPSLSVQTLEALLVLKASSNVYGKSYEVELSRDLLMKCKRATAESLK